MFSGVWKLVLPHLNRFGPADVIGKLRYVHDNIHAYIEFARIPNPACRSGMLEGISAFIDDLEGSLADHFLETQSSTRG
jgi:hypothetical protein